MSPVIKVKASPYLIAVWMSHKTIISANSLCTIITTDPYFVKQNGLSYKLSTSVMVPEGFFNFHPSIFHICSSWWAWSLPLELGGHRVGFYQDLDARPRQDWVAHFDICIYLEILLNNDALRPYTVLIDHNYHIRPTAWSCLQARVYFWGSAGRGAHAGFLDSPCISFTWEVAARGAGLG